MNDSDIIFNGVVKAIDNGIKKKRALVILRKYDKNYICIGLGRVSISFENSELYLNEWCLSDILSYNQVKEVLSIMMSISNNAMLGTILREVEDVGNSHANGKILNIT